MEQSLNTCANCGHSFTGNYCNNCGEKRYTEKDRKLVHLVEEAFHFITHFEGKFFKTLRSIFTKPGQLSTDYCRGVRKSYFKPLSLFLLLVVIYLLFPVFEGLNMKLPNYQTHWIYGKYASQKIAEVSAGRSMETMTEIFARKSEKVSKFLLPIIIPMTALLFWPLTFRRRRYFFDQVVFATEVNSFFLMAGYMLLPLLAIAVLLTYHLITGGKVGVGDSIIGPLLYTTMTIFVTLAARRFFGYNRFRALLLGLAYFFINYLVVHVAYKFILFVVVINQIH